MTHCKHFKVLLKMTFSLSSHGIVRVLLRRILHFFCKPSVWEVLENLTRVKTEEASVVTTTFNLNSLLKMMDHSVLCGWVTYIFNFDCLNGLETCKQKDVTQTSVVYEHIKKLFMYKTSNDLI